MSRCCNLRNTIFDNINSHVFWLFTMEMYLNAVRYTLQEIYLENRVINYIVQTYIYITL